MKHSLEDNIRQFCNSFKCNRGRYVAFAVRFVRNETVAEDLVNDSFVLFWENRHNLSDDTICEAYFYTIVKNKCLNYLRDKQTHDRVHDKIHSVSDRLLQYDLTSLENYDPNLIFSSEIREIMLRQLDAMPDLMREIFKSNRYDNMTYEEIAAKYDISVWKVAREMQSALAILRHALKDYLPMLLVLWSIGQFDNNRYF